MSNGGVPGWLKFLAIAGFVIALLLGWHSWKTYQWNKTEMRAWAFHIHNCHLPPSPGVTDPNMQGHSTPASCAMMSTHVSPPDLPPMF